MAQTASSSSSALAEMLGGLRLRARRVLVLRALGLVVAVSVGGVVALVLMDYVLRLPWGLRVVLLAAGLTGLTWCVRAWLARALGFRPSLTTMALRVEEAHAAQGSPGLGGELASALELEGAWAEQGETGTEPALTQSLRRSAVERATAAARQVRVESLIRSEPARRGLMAGAGASAVALVLIVLSPSLAAIGAQRLFLPWSDVQWPKRTGVVAMGEDGVHPAGEPVVLRALLTSTNRGLGQSEVDVELRVVRDGKADAWRMLPMASQRREGSIDREGELITGEVYERLTETPQLEREAVLEYRFVSADDRSESRELRLVPRPRLVGVEVDAALPAYAERAGVAGFLSGEALALDASERVMGASSPVLAGSDVVVSLRFNKPLPRWIDAAALAEEQLGDAGFAEGLERVGDGGVWRVSLKPEAQVAMTIEPRDEHGLTPPSPSVLRLEVVQDEPPAVAINEPARDEAVVRSAVVEIAGEGRDDIGLNALWLAAVRAATDGESVGAEAQAIGEETELARVDAEGADAEQVATELSIQSLGAEPGDEVWVWALATDVYEADGQLRPATRSAKRVLRVIEVTELEEQIRGELSAVRRAAMRLEGQQRELQESVEQRAATQREAAQQDALTRRIEAQQGALDRLAERIERNRLGDGPLRGLVEDAAAIAREASASSDEARRSLAEAADEQGQTEASQQAQQEAAEQAEQAQDEVRAALSDLVAALDRGEDAWVARRSVERLLEEQRSIAEDTARLGERTAGRTVDQLTPAERTELERILERQQRAAEAAGEAIEELDRRADQLSGRDPAQASALRDAASTGRRSQVQQQQENAAEAVGQNQTAQAGANQQQAIEALEEMLENIDDADARRDEVLQRVLASLIESIDALISQQQTEIRRLEQAEEDAIPALDEGMIRLDANTLAVIAMAREAPGETGRLVSHLESAREAQIDAIGALRAGNGKMAGRREATSLEQLHQAKAEAERLQEEAQQREQDRRLEELQGAYRELLERQVVLQSEVDEFVDEELTRRQRARVRGLGEQQWTLGEDLTAVRETNDDLEATTVFTLALDRIDAASAAAAESLRRGVADRSVQRSQATVARLLRSMLDALEQERPEQDEFGEGAQQGGGGGAGGGEQPLVPPIAELKLLRAMQIEAAAWTRAIDEEGASAAELSELTTLQQDLADRGRTLIEQMTQRPAAEESPAGGEPAPNRTEER